PVSKPTSHTTTRSGNGVWVREPACWVWWAQCSRACLSEGESHAERQRKRQVDQGRAGHADGSLAAALLAPGGRHGATRCQSRQAGEDPGRIPGVVPRSAGPPGPHWRYLSPSPHLVTVWHPRGGGAALPVPRLDV